MEDGIRLGRRQTIHDFLPEYLVIGAIVSFLGKRLLTVITCPNTAGIIRCESDEPHVVVSSGRTCFSCYGHAAVKLYVLTGTLRYNILKGVCEENRGGF